MTCQIGPNFLLIVKIDLKQTGSLSLTLPTEKLRQAPKALRAAGLVIVSMTQRAFTDPSLRPASWPPLAASTLKRRKSERRGASPLLKTGTLGRSPRIGELSNRSVSVVSDRPYAAYQQLGTKFAPARPFFPFTSSGTPTPRARQNIREALKAALNL